MMVFVYNPQRMFMHHVHEAHILHFYLFFYLIFFKEAVTFTALN